MPFRAVNPFSGELLSETAALDAAGIERALHGADVAQRHWRHRPLEQRLAVIARLGELLRAERDALALRATLEMGKPLRAALSEVDKCALLCDMAVQLAPRALAPERVTEDAHGCLARGVPAARRAARRDAVELPVLAGAAGDRAQPASPATPCCTSRRVRCPAVPNSCIGHRARCRRHRRVIRRWPRSSSWRATTLPT